ncbi:hypothetical protein KY285_017475 [Solanum tuberosum]|nr:hypothetical protein KY285_017475 [Solanum tuberosum]
MASQENNRPQSTSAVRRKSKGKKKVSETTDSQSQKFVEVGALDALGRLVIAPAGTIGFIPGLESADAIMGFIVSFYRDAWSSWEEVPVYDREQMWNHFKTQCAWCPEHEYHIFCNFEINAAFLLNKTLESAREMNEKPDWRLEGLWVRLVEKWTTEKFQKPSIQAKAPRTHQRILEKKKGRTMGYDEASILSKKIGEVKKRKAPGLGSDHCTGCIMYGFIAASLDSSQNQEEIDSEIDSL